MKKIHGVVVGALVGLFMMVPKASAAILQIDELNKIFFNGLENLFDSTGNFKAPTVAGLAVGDHLAGIINVQNITANGSTVFFAGASDQLTGVFAQRIERIDPLGGGAVRLIFGPAQVSTFCNGGDCFSIAGNLTGNEQFAFYLQQGAGTTIFTDGSTMALSKAAATDGSLYMTLGYDPGVDGIYGTPDDNGYAYGHPITDPLGQPKGEAFGGLNFTQNNTGFVFNKINDPSEFLFNNSVDLYFSAEFELNDNLKSAWKTALNDPAVVSPVIPEVSSLWLLGIGLSGLGLARPWRRAA